MTTKTYEEITFSDAEKMNEDTSAFVIRGAGHDDVRDSWIDGINEQLVNDEEIFANPVTEIYLLPVQGDRTDIVMVYGAEQEPDMGRMAMWRLRWAGDIAWLEDYIVNDAKHFSGGE
jgi:hypothetical protein